MLARIYIFARRENVWKLREAVGQGQPTEEGQVASAEVAAGGRQGPAAMGGGGEDGGQEQAAISNAAAATASAKILVPTLKNSTIHKKPTAEDPLTGVNLSCIPKIFRLRVGIVMEKLRERLKKGKIKSNQHIKHSASGSFPWRDVYYDWPKPHMIGSNISHIDFLLPYFCRISVHMPDKALAHHLPNGRMPCKWHGWDKDCCTNARVFSQHGPRTVFHENGSIEYKFYSTY
jgi:hypothetical protein